MHPISILITEKVINNYNIQNATINVAGVDINNLLLRATQFENANDVDKAIEYYNRVLDIDANRSEAIQGIKRLTEYYIGSTPISRQYILNIENLLNKNEKIQAIKLIRELTGLGLAEAKTFVDNYKPKLLNIGHNTATKIFKELDDNGLIERKSKALHGQISSIRNCLNKPKNKLSVFRKQERNKTEN